MTVSTKQKKRIMNLIPIVIGTAIYAFGLHYFVISNELMEGGITGIALLLNYSLSFRPSYTTLFLNIPLFVIGWRMFGGKAMFYTILGTLSLSFFLWIMEILIQRGWLIPFTTQDYLLAALYAGVTLGAGLGIVFRFGGTTGGSDILARIGQSLKGWSMGQVILFFDAAVIALSLFYIPREKVLYTLVTVFISSKVIDFIQEGAYAAKAFTIISDRTETIADAITRDLDRGITLFPAKGAYSKKQKEVVYCVVYRHEMRRLRALVKEMDPNAFMIISDVHDVLGEGFKSE
ncbi:YitT family protein [Ferviditalea candida]|uniref:YitT family protein n=1 Tax=Ferviditalea candida TaxID=3108399 RepID=A0ABU5ZFK9_9BACL|nr:YitT family protein [Paenibacillaceae bacterium T2]